MSIYYISAAGSNSNDGLSESTPWLTIGKVNVNMGVHTFKFREGDTFSDTSLVITAACTITRYGINGLSNPIIDGGTTFVGIYIDACTGATIERLRFVNDISAGLYNVNVRTGVVSSLTVQDCHFSAGEYGFRSDAGTSGTGNIIRRCTFGPVDGAISDDGVSNNGDWHCEVYECYFAGIGIGGAGGDGDPLSAHDTCTINAHHNIFIGNRNGGYRHVNTSGTNIFRNNFVYWNDEGGTTICRQEGGGQTDAYNNVVILDGTALVLVFTNDASTAGASISHFWNNTVLCRNANTGTFLFSNTRTAGVVSPTMHVKNCIAYMNNATSRLIKSDPALTVYVGDNNSFSHTTAGRFVLAVGVDFAAWKAGWVGQDVASVTGDPSFVSPAGTTADAARFVDGSNCQDAGQDLSGSFALDYAGRNRPYGAAWDIGAYEFGAGLPGFGGGFADWWALQGASVEV